MDNEKTDGQSDSGRKDMVKPGRGKEVPGMQQSSSYKTKKPE